MQVKFQTCRDFLPQWEKSALVWRSQKMQTYIAKEELPMSPFCLSFPLNQNPETGSNMKENKNNSTLPTYFILKLCLELRREVGIQCYHLYPLNI